MALQSFQLLVRTFCIILSAVTLVQAAVYLSQECGQIEQHIDFGDLYTYQTPNYPDPYNSNSSCIWKLTAPKGSRILVKIIDIDTEYCCDKLIIGNGRNANAKKSWIFSHGGLLTANKAFASNGYKLWMRFTSNEETNRKGFSVDVIAYPKSDIVSCPGGKGHVLRDDVCYCETPPKDSNCVCQEDEFQCSNGRCLPQTSVCNELKDCQNAEDEINCHPACPKEARINLEMGERRVIASDNYPIKYSPLQHCQWLFSGPEYTVIAIRFDDSLLRREDFIAVGNGADPEHLNSTIRAISGTISPGTQYTSSSSELWMRFDTDNTFGDKGFQLTVLPVIQVCSDINHLLPFDVRYTFQSPNYPSPYNSNSTCVWTFTGPKVSRILVKIIDIDTEYCCDKLIIGNGIDPEVKQSLIFSHGGLLTANKAFASTGSELWMKFTTNEKNNRKGFSVDVAAYRENDIVSCPEGKGHALRDELCHCEIPPGDVNCKKACQEDEFQCYNGRCLPQTSVCNDFKDCVHAEDEINCHPSCPNNASVILQYGDKRVISSANYPAIYDSLQHCLWLFSGPEDAVLAITFDDSHLQREDFIVIGSGMDPGDLNSTTRAISGDISSGTKYVSSGSELWMTFDTDNTLGAKGFRLTVQPVLQECSIIDQNITFDAVHTFQTPNYPDHYNSNSSCVWKFTGPEGSRILIKIIDIDTEYCCDKLIIGNGRDPDVKQSWIFSHGGLLTANKAFASTGSELWMKFTSNEEKNRRGISVDVAAYPEIEIVACPGGNGAALQDEVCYCGTPPEDADCACQEDEFQCYNGRCLPQTSVCNDFKDCTHAEDEINCHPACPKETSGYLQYGERRVISSDNYPAKYSSGQHCRWLFSGPKDARIVIKFDDSELERNDYIVIGNGMDPGTMNSTVRAISDTIETGQQYASSGSEMWMTFDTDNKFGEKGFQISVTSERVDEVHICFDGNGVATLEDICDQESICQTNAEYLCECELGQYQCYNRRCIDGAKECDETRDCNEGEDEINCHQKCPQDQDVFFMDYGPVFRIQSADYPNQYPANLHCRWLFESPEGSLLVIRVIEFYVDDRGADRLVFGSGSDSNIIAKLTGQVTSGSQYASSGNEAWMKFETDRIGTAPGWVLELSAVRKNEVKNCVDGLGIVTADNICEGMVNCETEHDDILCSCNVGDFKCYNNRCVPSEKRCNGQIDCARGEDEMNCHASCPDFGDPVILEYGTRLGLSSDGYPGNYGNNIHCRWLFRGPPESVIVVKFNDFQLDVQGDQVMIGDGLYPGNVTSVIRELAGEVYEGRQESSITSELWMTFFSNSRRNGRGFSTEVFARPSTEVYQCLDDGGVVTQDDICESNSNCEHNANDYRCDCDESQFQCYNTRCVDMEKKCDNNMDCELGEDEINCHDQCPGEDKIILKYDDIHEITSANYPMDYANNMYCRWRFQGPQDSVVVVRIMDFDLNRYGDQLVIGSGNFSGDLSRLLIELTAKVRPGIQFASDEPGLWMTFLSNFHGTAKGFRFEIFAQPGHEVFVCFDQSGVLTKNNVCDEIANCISEADELVCVCRSDQFMCRNGRCINDDYRCDENYDCMGGEDEANCHEDCPMNTNVTLQYDTPTMLQSANHPGSYSSNIHCLWLLIGPPDAFLKIKVREFELESLRDTLRIGYGLDPGQSSTVIEVLTGKIERDITILVTSPYAWLTFLTDETVNLGGFSLEVIASRKVDATVQLN